MLYSKDDFALVKASVLFTSLAAWVAIALAHGGGGHSPAGAVCGAGWLPWLSAEWMASALQGWALMLVAMMAPLTLTGLAYIRFSVLSDQRWSASGLFLLGYGVLWLLAGLPMLGVEAAVRAWPVDPLWSAMLTALVAYVWQCSPAKQRCLNRCHAYRPLAVFGYRATLDAVCMGFEHAVWCLGSCWALMLWSLMLTDGHLVGMLLVMGVMLRERAQPPLSPQWRWRGLRPVAAWLVRACRPRRWA